MSLHIRQPKQKALQQRRPKGKTTSDGTTASYYELPEGVETLEEVVSAKNMNFQIGFIFLSCYDYSTTHRDSLRLLREMKNCADLEIQRLTDK